MGSEWTEVGAIYYEDLALIVQQRDGFVRLTIADHGGELSIAMAAGAREQFQRLFMEAERRAETPSQDGEVPDDPA